LMLPSKIIGFKSIRNSLSINLIFYFVFDYL
jgi:hypothetical protein